MRLHVLGCALPALALVALASAAQADITITTIPAWNGSSLVHDWGIPNSATYGQTIMAPLTDDTLTSFTFELNGPAGTPYMADVYAWDGSKATGSALYQSPTLTTPGPNGTFTAVTTNTGGVTLTPGDQYVLFLTTSGLQAGQNTAGFSWGQPQNQNIYNGGAFVFLNNGNDPSALTTQAWSQGFLGAGGDLAFSATFTSAAVPEPGSIAMLFGMGLTGAGFLLKKRRR